MPDKKTLTKKTLLGSIVIPMWVFAIQQVLQGSYYVGGVAIIIAVGLFGLYEYVGLKQIPTDASELKNLSERVGEVVKEQTE